MADFVENEAEVSDSDSEEDERLQPEGSVRGNETDDEPDMYIHESENNASSGEGTTTESESEVEKEDEGDNASVFGNESERAAESDMEEGDNASVVGNKSERMEESDMEEGDNAAASVVGNEIETPPAESDMEDGAEAANSDEDEDRIGSTKKRRKRLDDDEFEEGFDDRLEDDDYDLLEENLGVKLKRNKFKRLKAIEDDSDSEEDEGTRILKKKETIAAELFGGSDSEPDESSSAPQPWRRPEPETYASESESESENDDWIVGDDGLPLRENYQPGKKYSSERVRQAEEVFGEGYGKDIIDVVNVMDEAEDEEDEGESDSSETSVSGRTKKTKLKKSKITDMFEPSVLDLAGISDEARKIRAQDIPERHAIRIFPITEPAEELDEECTWIYNRMFLEQEFKFAKKKRPITEDIEDEANNANDDATSSFAIAPSVFGGENVPIAPRSELNFGEEIEDAENKASLSTLMPPPPAPKSVQRAAPDDDWGDDWGDEETPATQAVQPIVAPTPATLSKANSSFSAGNDDDWNDVSDKDKDIFHKMPDKSNLYTSLSAREKKYADEYRDLMELKIRRIVTFIRRDLFEVPFIYYYRKEVIEPEINYNHLWTIYDLDEQFCRLYERRKRLLALFLNMQAYQEFVIEKEGLENVEKNGMRLLTNDDIALLSSANTVAEVQDMISFFTLYYSHDIPAMNQMVDQKSKELQKALRAETTGVSELTLENEVNEDEVEALDGNKLKKRVSFCGLGTYRIFKNSGISPMLKFFGLTAEEFGENLREGYEKIEVRQFTEDLMHVAQKCVSSRWTDPCMVRDAAKMMMAFQISRDPLVKKSVRQIFFIKATVSVRPTKKGFIQIDENHPMSPMKYVTNKPALEIIEDSFMKMLMAEKENLIEIEIGKTIASLTGPSYLEHAKKMVQKDEYSVAADGWNSFRSDVVTYAFENLLYPEMRKDLRLKLQEDATKFILKACRDKVYQHLKVAPYTKTFPDEQDEDWSTVHGIRVLSFVYTDGGMLDVCLLSGDGMPLETIRYKNMMSHIRHLGNEEFEKKIKEMAHIQNFIASRKPHVLVIGGECRKTKTLQFELRNIVGSLNDNGKFITIEVMDPEAARIYANSSRAVEEFPDMPVSLRKAISLGRRLQDPLLEYSQLFTQEKEILLLKLHELQDQVPQERLLDVIQIEFIDRTNEVGVEVNSAVALYHKSNVVQFLCGLGFHKANGLLRNLRTKNVKLENRFQLVTFCGLGHVTFMNCGPFVRVDVDALGPRAESFVELLDKTRIHPEMYEHAKKLASEALDLDNEDTFLPGVIEEIMNNPEPLQLLDLNKYNEYLMDGGSGDKLISLESIRQELTKPFYDVRTPYESPDREEIFYILAKETPETLYPGRLVVAQVQKFRYRVPEKLEIEDSLPEKVDGKWRCPFCRKMDFQELMDVWTHFDNHACPGSPDGITIRLNNGISGIITLANFSDKQPVENITERIAINQAIHCRVVSIDAHRFSVECTCKTSALAAGSLRRPRDTHYDTEAERADIAKYKVEAEVKSRRTYLKRVIVHSCFQNISYKESEELLQKMDQGDVIFRPSSKGVNHLTASWKVTNGITQHIDILETGKLNDYTIGKCLQIGEMDFEDFDEIVARFISPMAAHARDIISFKYYKAEDCEKRENAEAILLAEQKLNPRKSHYLISASRKLPGKFVLAYLPKAKTSMEYFTVTHNGLRYRQQYFDTIGSFLHYFKNNYKEHFPSPSPSSSFVSSKSGQATTIVTGITGVSRVAGNSTPFGNTTPYLGRTTPGQYSHIPPLPTNENEGSMSQRTVNTPMSMTIGMTPKTPRDGSTPYTPSCLTPGPYMTPGYTTPGQVPTTPGQYATPGGQTPGQIPGTPAQYMMSGRTPGQVPGTPGQYMTPGRTPGQVPIIPGQYLTPGRTPGSVPTTPGPLYGNMSVANIPLPPPRR